MVLKHATKATDKIVDARRSKLVAAKREVTTLKRTFTPLSKLQKAQRENSTLKREVAKLKKTLDSSGRIEGEFNFGFALSLILLCRSYPPLHEHAFHIFQEAGYELSDFAKTKLDPSDLETLHQIFST